VVYLGCMTSAVRILRGPARLAAIPAAVIVAAVLAYCGWSLVAPVAVILAVGLAGPLARAARAGFPSRIGGSLTQIAGISSRIGGFARR
jgi:hypothetical protein